MSLMLEDPPASAARPRVTAEDLLAMPNDKDFELVNGELVERNMSWESERIGSNVLGLVWNHCRQHNLGEVNGSNAGYQCFEEVFPDDADRTRKPDVSFISRERLPKQPVVKGNCLIVPDLAVEVVSPNDLYHEVEEKVEEYLQAGVRLVWVVDPHKQRIRIHRANGTVQDLRPHDELSGEDVLVGFRCPVSEVFRLPGA
ncbi:MAG: Uma2 family endonuclease [Planctomycetaceae bacterium]